MKKMIIFCIFSVLFAGAAAQPQFTAQKTDFFPKALEAVLHDFPSNFRNISGELVLKQAEIDNYESLVKLPGATECIITRYHSVEDTTASWQAKMFQSEEFTDATQQYRMLYQKIKNCYLKLVDGSIIFLSSEWEAPTDEKSFVMSTFRLKTGDHRYKEMKIDLEMVFQFPEWVININVVSKKNDSLKGYANEDGN